MASRPVIYIPDDAPVVMANSAAYAALQTRAGRIDDPELQDSFLNRVATHRSIVDAYEALASDA